jgi:hypothetical protein
METSSHIRIGILFGEVAEIRSASVFHVLGTNTTLRQVEFHAR